MKYDEATLRRDLEKLKIAKWNWEAQKNPFSFDELVKYCWRAYDAAYNSQGHLVIGRVQHLDAADLYAQVAEIVKEGTLFSDRAQGNLLKMDKWACAMNDSWILGGVHSDKTFRLASPRVMENLWNADAGFLIVTARELIGLLSFGYALDQAGPWQILELRDAAKAAEATLLEYDRVIEVGGTFRRAVDLIDQRSPHARLMAEIRARPKRLG